MKTSVVVVGYLVIAQLLNMTIARPARDVSLFRFPASPFILLSAPATIFWLFALWLISIPYVWIYPERVVTSTDLQGSEEEKKALSQLRAVLRQKSLFRRLAEKFGVTRPANQNGRKVNAASF